MPLVNNKQTSQVRQHTIRQQLWKYNTNLLISISVKTKMSCMNWISKSHFHAHWTVVLWGDLKWPLLRSFFFTPLLELTFSSKLTIEEKGEAIRPGICSVLYLPNVIGLNKRKIWHILGPMFTISATGSPYCLRRCWENIHRVYLA